MTYNFIIVLLPLVAALGCSTKQQYTVRPPSQLNAMIAERDVVVEVLVKESRRAMEWSLTQPLGNGKYREDAVAVVNRVIKGGETSSQLKLSNYRPLTKQELATFPDAYAIHTSSKLFLGYDSRWGSAFKNLCIVSAGNTAEFDAVLRQADEIRAKATSRKSADGRPDH